MSGIRCEAYKGKCRKYYRPCSIYIGRMMFIGGVGNVMDCVGYILSKMMYVMRRVWGVLWYVLDIF